MKISKKEYSKMVGAASKPSPKIKDFILAFTVGGLICTIGQLFMELYTWLPLSVETAKSAVSVTLIFIAAVLTGIGVFDNIARFAGAGTLVPITGFANAMVSPAIEYKNEGRILGLGAKMFTIAGPVIVYGITASAIYGLILWIVNMI
ncbi:MAG: stage V sporulation protein AC [Oscillospiraceae bacterium]